MSLLRPRNHKRRTKKRFYQGRAYFLLCSILFTNCLFSQKTAQIVGKVTDSLTGNPIELANIIAIPAEDNVNISYTTSSDKGMYKLVLVKGTSYQLTVNHIGYNTKVKELLPLTNVELNFTLTEKVIDLQEVTIDYTPPVNIKKDTITYDTDAFVSGEERKLREVLKKLPGIEVDREGNVTAQGRKVKKVLVEDKTFFTGNSKLAVNNIPADAVDKVQVLENYNEIGFLKNLQDSDEIALNIKLKEDKKKFAFGDIESGGGVEDRYVVHPTLFYYSPKTNINFIGDLNNTGAKSFTLSDYLEFNGGFGTLLNDIGSFARLSNDDFSQFLLDDDFRANTNRFGAINFRQTLSKKTDLNSFIIANASDTETRSETLNTFNGTTAPLNENRTRTNDADSFFLLGKLTIDYEPNTNTDLKANTFVKFSDNQRLGQLSTQSPAQNNEFNTLTDLKGLELKQHIAYNKRFSRAQTIGLESSLAFTSSQPGNNWISNQPFLQGSLPLQNETTIDILQERETQSLSANLLLKDYWVLNNFNHLYTSLGTNLSYDSFQSQEVQNLTNGNTNDFSENGFGNSIDYRLSDYFAGLEYKFLAGIFTVKSGLFYHHFNWENTQNDIVTRNVTNALLPEFNAEAEFSSSEKLRFRYRQRYRFPKIAQLAQNFFLNSFNSVLQGNANLNNERLHSYSLTYNKFSLFRGLQLNTGIFYNRKSQSIKNTTVLDGIEQFTSYTIFNTPENSISANFNFSKRIIDPLKLGIEANGTYNEFFQLVNGSVSKNISRSLSLIPKVQTYFEKWPNVEIGYSYEPSEFSTAITTNTFTNEEFFFNVDHTFLKDFQLKADYRKTIFTNQSQNLENSFDTANASLFYQKEDSPWGFEVSATNLFNIDFKRQSSFSDFLISDQTTFIVPRIVLLKVAYKF